MKNPNIRFKTITRLVKSLNVGFVSLFVVTLSSWAGTPGLEGVVRDPAGRPIKGADVRIEAKNLSKIVKTDASGHYICDRLAVGTYRVTLVVNGSVAASALSATTKPGSHTQLNFDLTANSAPAKKHTHMVYAHPDVDTHIGGGRWVEVDDNGNIVSNTGPNSNTGASSVEKVNGSALQTLQVNKPNPAKFGGQ